MKNINELMTEESLAFDVTATYRYSLCTCKYQVLTCL